MIIKNNDVFKLIESFAPLKTAYEWDNSGITAGDRNGICKKILLALDVTDEVIDEAIKLGANLIITHHPLIFSSIKKITTDNWLGKRLIFAIKNDITLYAAHTNLDICHMGTSIAFAEKLGIKNLEPFIVDNDHGLSLGNIGYLDKQISLGDFLMLIKHELNLCTVGYSGKLEKPVQKIGFCTGSGSSAKYVNRAVLMGCDVYISSDFTFHDAQNALYQDICIVDATHFASEYLVLEKLKHVIENALGDIVNISKHNGQVMQYFT